MNRGTFVISLDFELYWGVRDSRNLDSYGSNIIGARKAILAMLDLFDRYNVKVTFATVGFLFCSGKKELLQFLPDAFPAYNNQLLSPYHGYFDDLGKDETEDIYHFAPSLINMIRQRKHEIATHTFSHYYCLEKGQTTDQFRDDLRTAKKIALKFGIDFKSIIFPRNQYSNDYLEICRSENIKSFRGNEEVWFYRTRSRSEESLGQRALRLVDSYINISGYHAHEPTAVNGICNIPSSRFLRPYNRKLAWFEGLKLHRIKNQMSFAARQKKIFHLWWHPHNFGNNLEKNLCTLEEILLHYKKLHQSGEFISMTMDEVASEFLLKKNDQE